MNDKIVTFAALKSFYDSNQDLLGVFGNLILLVILKDKPTSLSLIKDELIKKIEFDVPEDVLRTITKRLNKNGFVSYSNIKDKDFKSIILTEKGLKQQEKVRANYDKAKRDKSAIIESMDKRGMSYPKKILNKELDLFIENSVEYAITVLENDNEHGLVSDKKIQKAIANFFINSEKSDPETFERLKSFLYGKIISKAFLEKRFDKNTKIDDLTIYLDTNILFSLMGFDGDSENNLAKELISLIRSMDITIKVFSFTADEAKIKLRGYLSEYGYYSSQIKVESIYQVLKRNNFTKIDVISLIESFEEKLEKLDIQIDYTQDLEELIKDKNEELLRLASYKNRISLFSDKHDLAAIHAIISIRLRRERYLWEKSSAIFLTSDNRLARFDLIEHKHKDLGTFPEIIHRSDMVSMLWLKGKSGSENIFLQGLFASHIREKVIDSNLWSKFTKELKKMKESNTLSQGDIDRIISLSETEIILREKGEKGITEILDDENILRIKKSDLNLKKSIQENEDTILSQSKQIEDFIEAIIEEGRRFWPKLINIFVWLFIGIIIIFTLFLIYRFGLSNTANIIQILTIVFFIVIGISVTQKKEFRFLGFLIKKRNDIENRLITWSIKRKKKRYRVIMDKVE